MNMYVFTHVLWFSFVHGLIYFAFSGSFGLIYLKSMARFQYMQDVFELVVFVTLNL